MDKEGSFKPIIVVMFVSIIIAFFWDSFPIIKNTANIILNPSAGALLNWNLTYGMIIIILIISLFMTLLQKYATDQKTIKRLKDEQKELQKNMKEYKNHPEKLIEMQKNTFPLTIELMKHSMRPMIYTGVPLILFFRWFMDFFAIIGDYKFFGLLSWFWFYLIGSMIFSIILRKILKVA
jgi:uncharacterized membrane protein (DUF106 family)